MRELCFVFVCHITGEELHILTYSPSQCDHDIGLFSKSFLSLIGDSLAHLPGLWLPLQEEPSLCSSDIATRI